MYVAPAAMGTGVAKFTCCQPDGVSLIQIEQLLGGRCVPPVTEPVPVFLLAGKSHSSVGQWRGCQRSGARRQVSCRCKWPADRHSILQVRRQYGHTHSSSVEQEWGTAGDGDLRTTWII